jgi:hypothetical protein
MWSTHAPILEIAIGASEVRTSDVGQIEIEAVLLEALLVLTHDVARGHLQSLSLLP